MSKIFAAFDEVNIGAFLTLSQGDQIIQTSTTVDAHRIARGTVGLLSFSGQVEFIVYSPDSSNPSLATVSSVPPVTLGIVRAADSLAKFVGEDSTGYGLAPDGTVWHNNAIIATIGGYTYGDYVSVLLDPVGGTLQFVNNGQSLGGAIAIATGQTWYYAASVSGQPNGIAVYANSGTTPIRYPQGVGGGWWMPSATVGSALVATEPTITKSTDSLANTIFFGDIDRAQPLKIKRSVQFWPWGPSMPGQLGKSLNPIGSTTTQISMRLLDPNNIYSRFITGDVRDVQVPIYRIPHDGAFDSAEQCFLGILDSVHADTDQTKIVYLTDFISQLQQPLNRPLFPPNVDASVAGKPRPISLGPCRNYMPTLYDAANALYAAHDTNLSALGTQRQNGKPLVINTDYQMLPDASGFKLLIPTGGKFTAESTSTGAAYDPAGTDLLIGSGNFLTATPDGGGHPTGWLTNSTGTSTPIWQVDATYGVVTPSDVNGISSIGKTTVTFGNGTYVVQVTVSISPDFGAIAGQYVDPADMYVGFWEGGTFQYNSIVGPLQQLRGAKVYTYTIINNTGRNLNFGLYVRENQVDSIFDKIGISSIKIQLIPDVAANAVLTPLTLTKILNAVMVQRGPLTGVQVSTTESDAIDTATGYGYGIHLEPTDQPQVQAVVKKIMDSCTGDVFQARDGRVHEVRLIGPESATAIGSLTVTDIDGYLEQFPDNAENLTTRMQGCPNISPYSSGDFGTTSLADVPLVVRNKLEQDYQWTAVAGVQLPARYAYAANASPQTTVFDLIADGQAEIKRINTLYSVMRNFYVAKVFTPIGRALEIGDVYNVTYPLGTLTAGQNLLVVGVEEEPSSETSTISFWGL